MTAPVLLSIDPGRHSGWATSEPRMSGAIDHEITAMEEWWGPGERRGMKTRWRELKPRERFKRIVACYSLWLENLIVAHEPELLVLEMQSPQPGRGHRSAHAYAQEYAGASHGVAAIHRLSVMEPWPAQWRGLLGDDPYDPAIDHQKAAETMLAWAEREIGAVRSEAA